MNSKILIGVVAIVILLGGVLLLSNRTSNKQAAPTPAIEQQQPSVTAIPTTQASPSASEQAMKETTVTVTSSGFSPNLITIKKGTKVIWVNKSGDIANVSSDPHPIHTDYPPLNLNNFNDGGSVSLVFNDAGTYKYHNHLNSSQKGTVVVE